MRFVDGENVHKLIFPDDSYVTVGEGVDEIKVVMEWGQMSNVPWFEVYRDGEIIDKWNGALISGVRLTNPNK